MSNNIPTTDCFKTFWSEMANEVMQIQACFSFFFFVYFTQTSSDGNVNEKKKTSLPLHQMIFSRKHLHRLLRIAEGKDFIYRTNHSFGTITEKEKNKINFFLYDFICVSVL